MQLLDLQAFWLPPSDRSEVSISPALWREITGFVQIQYGFSEPPVLLDLRCQVVLRSQVASGRLQCQRTVPRRRYRPELHGSQVRRCQLGAACCGASSALWIGVAPNTYQASGCQTAAAPWCRPTEVAKAPVEKPSQCEFTGACPAPAERNAPHAASRICSRSAESSLGRRSHT